MYSLTVHQVHILQGLVEDAAGHAVDEVGLIVAIVIRTEVTGVGATVEAQAQEGYVEILYTSN